MALMEMYKDVFSNISRSQRAVPENISQKIKKKISLNNVVTYGRVLKKAGTLQEGLKTLIRGWVLNKKNTDATAKYKKQLVIRAYDPEITWEAYEGMLLSMGNKPMAKLLLDEYSEDDKGSVSQVHKARLLQCITYAIKIGLNYQVLKPFAVNLSKVPKKLFLDEEEIVYPKDKLVSKKEEEELKKQTKVHLEDLKALPLYEGITFPPADLGEYIRTSTLKAMEGTPDQLVNSTKRNVLQLLYNISRDFKLNLDELDQKSLKKLCGLPLNPIRDQASEYYNCVEHEERLLALLDRAYNNWLSDKSYKKYIGERSPRQFLKLEPIRDVGIQSVDDVLAGNFDALQSLMYYQKPSVSGLPELSEYEPDMEYARSLGVELQRLDVLPAGYDYLCAVKAQGLQPGKRKITIRGETLEIKSDEPEEAKSDEPDAER